MTDFVEKLRERLNILAEIRHNPDLFLTKVEKVDVCNERGSHEP